MRRQQQHERIWEQAGHTHMLLYNYNKKKCVQDDCLEIETSYIEAFYAGFISLATAWDKNSLNVSFSFNVPDNPQIYFSYDEN